MIGRSNALLPLILSSLCSRTVISGGLPRRDWSDLNLDLLEEEWKIGDEEPELAHPDDELHRLSEKAKDEAHARLEALISEAGVDDGGGRNGRASSSSSIGRKIEQAAKEAQHAGQSAMIFTTLRKDIEGRGEWDWDAISEVCDEWAYRLSFAMVEIKCYPTPPDGVLVVPKHGWRGQDVYDFLSNQSDLLTEVSWNDRKVDPRSFAEE